MALYCRTLDRLAEGAAAGASGRRDASGREGTSALAGIGVSVCGYVNDEGLPELTNMPVLDGYPVTTHLADQYALPVTIDNDVNAAALAEYRFGAGRGARRLVVAAAGYGIGIGAILGGRMVRFTGGTTGNLGHLILDPGSPDRCGLGCRGCLETKATAPAIERRALALAQEDPGGPLGRRLAESGRLVASDVKLAADGGDPGALEVLRETGRWLGAGLASFAAVFSPDVIVIGGGLSEMGPVVEAATASFYQAGMPYVTGAARVVPAALGNDAALIGAMCAHLPSA